MRAARAIGHRWSRQLRVDCYWGVWDVTVAGPTLAHASPLGRGPSMKQMLLPQHHRYECAGNSNGSLNVDSSVRSFGLSISDTMLSLCPAGARSSLIIAVSPISGKYAGIVVGVCYCRSRRLFIIELSERLAMPVPVRLLRRYLQWLLRSSFWLCESRTYLTLVLVWCLLCHSSSHLLC